MKTQIFESFVLSSLTGFALTVDAFVGGNHAARFAVVLGILNLLHAFGRPWFTVCRELLLYLLLVCYMLTTLLWTDNVGLGLGTVLLAVNFALIMLLVSSLFAYHDLTAVLKGLRFGFLCGAVGYFLRERFPLIYPEGFSYNTMAGMYLFGLFITMLCGWYLRSHILTMCLGLILLLHIAATTSIKTNLGIALGVATAGLIYFRYSLRVFLRNFVVLLVLCGTIWFAIVSSESLSERVQYGVARVFAGAQILAAHEDASGSSGFVERQQWKSQGLAGWARNPLLGYGVEAFRADYEITSHSTVVDLLYNSGLIGFGLFYSMFASLGWRVARARGTAIRGLQTIVVAGLVCYWFMSLSATLYYDTFIAAFIAICVGVLARADKGSERSSAQSEATAPSSPNESATA